MKKTVFRERFRRIAAAILITVLTFLLLSCGSSSKPAGREENRSDQVSSGSGDNKSAESFQVEFTYNTDVVGEPPAAQKVTEGDLLEMPYVAPVTGYKLLGWVREDRPAYPYDFSLPVTKSFRLTGIWLDTSLDMTDTDQDELSDALEEMLRTDPSGWDTDNDGCRTEWNCYSFVWIPCQKIQMETVFPMVKRTQMKTKFPICLNWKM